MRLSAAAVLLAASLALPPVPAPRAEEEVGHDRALRALRGGEIAPLPEILDVAARRVRGSVIEVELLVRDRRYVYEVEMLTPGGTLVTTLVDARTKAVLGTRDDSDELARGGEHGR